MLAEAKAKPRRDEVERPSTQQRASHDDSGPLLSKAEYEAWQDFSLSSWQPFKAAWLARGFRKPPAGSATDDDTSQRGLLWQIAQARPMDLGRWVAAAPPKATARQVVAHVLEEWQRVRAQVAATPAVRNAGPENAGAILERLMRKPT
jgi:hypothetical protein